MIVDQAIISNLVNKLRKFGAKVSVSTGRPLSSKTFLRAQKAGLSDNLLKMYAHVNGWDIEWSLHKVQGKWSFPSYEKIADTVFRGKAFLIETIGNELRANWSPDGMIHIQLDEHEAVNRISLEEYIKFAIQSYGHLEWRSSFLKHNNVLDGSIGYWPLDKVWHPDLIDLAAAFPKIDEIGGLTPYINVNALRKLASMNPISQSQCEAQAKPHLQATEQLFMRKLEWQTLVVRDLPIAMLDTTEDISGLASFEHGDLQQCRFNAQIWPFANFCGCLAQSIDFQSAVLFGTTFTDADLRNADFRQADLRNADFSRADLRGARFDKAQLAGADFENVILSNEDGTQAAQFNDCKTWEATFSGAVLRK